MEIFKKVFTPKVIDEIKSIITTFVTLFISFIAVDGFNVLQMLWDGDLSYATITALSVAVLRSAIKSILVILFPTLFKRG